MIKNHLFLADSLTFISSRLFNTSNCVSYKWFYKFKVFMNPPKAYPSFKDDWEHKLGLDLKFDEPILGVTELEEYHKLPDIMKKCYTNRFLNGRDHVIREISNKAKLLGVTDFENKLAYQIIKHTIQIRNCKKMIKTEYRDSLLVRSLKKWIVKRHKEIRQLEMENGPLMAAICEEFNIKVVKEEPRIYVDDDPIYKAANDDAKSIKSKKVKAFREDLADSKEEFFKRKKIELEIIKENLKNINLNIDDVYREVIFERREQSMEPIDIEKYGWFEKEKELKILHAAKLAEKKAARERKQRR